MKMVQDLLMNLKSLNSTYKKFQACKLPGIFLAVISSGIEPEYQVPETCVLSIVLRDQKCFAKIRNKKEAMEILALRK